MFILTYHGFHFSKDLWPKLSSLCSCLNLSYISICVMSRKLLMWCSWSLEAFLHFSTSFWLDEGILLSCQNSYTGTFTTSMSFISERGNLPTKDHTIFCFPLSSNIFGNNSTWNLQRFDSTCHFLPQWGQVGLSNYFFTIDLFLVVSFPFYHFLNFRGFLYTFSIPCFTLLASRWITCTNTSSMLVGLHIKIVWWK